MSFISRNNFVTLEDIDLETNLIGVLLNNRRNSQGSVQWGIVNSRTEYQSLRVVF